MKTFTHTLSPREDATGILPLSNRLLIKSGLAILIISAISAFTAKADSGSGRSCFLDGNSYVEINDNPDTKGMNTFSFEAWVMKPTGSSSQEPIFCKENAYLLTFNGSTFEFKVNNESSVTSSNVSLSTNEWVHVAVVFNGNLSASDRKKIYINGVLDATGSTPETTISNNTNKLYFGTVNTGSSTKFNGFVDEARFWNKPLSQSDIRTNLCTKLVGNESGLVGYWKMDGQDPPFENYTSFLNLDGASAGAQKVLSGAPVGDASVYSYGSNTLTYTHTDGDGLTINNFSTTPSGMYIYVVNSSPDFYSKPSGFASISSLRYYGVFIAKNNNTSVGYDITYDNYDAHPGWQQVNESSLKLATRSDNSDQQFDDASATQNTTANTLLYSSPVSNTSGRTETSLGSGIDPLPVTLMSFTAVATGNGNEVAINWTTAGEVNNSHFNVERSQDGINFIDLSRVRGAGNTQVQQQYAITDYPPVAGTYYYRLKQTDYNGTTEYFPVVAVRLREGVAENDIQILSSNPVTEKLVISLPLAQPATFQATIRSYTGQVISSRTISTKGVAEIPGMNELPAGHYLLFVTWNGQSAVKKFVKLN